MKKKPDIPFSSDSSRFFVPWLSMLMVFIATLMLSIAMITYSSIQTWNKNISGSLTVQIPTYDESGRSRAEKLDNDVEMTLTLLRSSEGVTGATVLTNEQMDSLMAPWLGDHTATSELPLPKIIDVTVDSNNFPDLNQIKADLTEQVPSAVLDSHRAALAELINLSDNVINLIGILLFLLILTTAFSIMYATRSSLAVHQKVIELIHMMGANDFYITIQFAIRSLKLTLIGSYAGFVLALPIMALFAYFLNNMNGSFILHASLSYLQWIILIITPLLAGLLAFLTAYKTVTKALKQIL